MYKLLLADDEQIVLDSLQFIIKQQYGDDMRVEVAHSGREAITLAEQVHPDLAIFDINMPGINGIEAIKTIRELSPGTQFILLTAFDKFDYAKQAITLGVLNYLMKPFNKKRIVDAIDSAIELIDAARQKRMSELAMREKLENVRSILEIGFFYSIFFADDQTSETMRYLELLDIPSPTGLIVTLEFGERLSNGYSPNRIGQHVRLNRDFSSLRESIKMIVHCLVGPLLLNRIVVFIPIEAEMSGSLRDLAPDFARQIFEKIEKAGESELRMGVSSIVESISQFHDAYQESLLALQQTPGGEIRFYSDLLPAMTGGKGQLEWLETSFLQSTRQGDFDLASQYFNQLLTLQENADNHDLGIVRGKVLEWLILAARQTDNSNAASSGSSNTSPDYQAILGSLDITALRQNALDRIRSLTMQFSGSRGRPVSDMITAARAFIDEHYAGNISLESVAESIALSAPYLSRLFSSQIGKTFIDYLTDLRIAKACQLLREGRLSIKEISSAVGYSDPNYFSRIFKRVISQTPSEYRN
ncbi:MAG: response regulator [Eubacteriales bacterium]|nr:response regulator [Eubacteriales bacterium]